MANVMTTIESEYQRRIDALSGKERVARSMAMLQWTRDVLARQIVAKSGAISEDKLRWEVARRLYSSDQAICAMIDRKLADVSS